MKQYCKNCVYESLPKEHILYNMNDLIFLEGEQMRSVYRVKSGFVKVLKYLENGDEKVLNIFGPGDYIALIAVLQEHEVFVATAIALTIVELQKIDVNFINKAYATNNIFRETCLSCALTRTNFFQLQITHSNNLNIEDKIMNVLKSLKSKFSDKVDDIDSITLPFPKHVLANLIGIRRETLSRYLSILQKKNLLRIKKNTYIFL